MDFIQILEVESPYTEGKWSEELDELVAGGTILALAEGC